MFFCPLSILLSTRLYKSHSFPSTIFSDFWTKTKNVNLEHWTTRFCALCCFASKLSRNWYQRDFGNQNNQFLAGSRFIYLSIISACLLPARNVASDKSEMEFSLRTQIVSGFIAPKIFVGSRRNCFKLYGQERVMKVRGEMAPPQKQYILEFLSS